MKIYTLKWSYAREYDLYDGETLVSDADLLTMFQTAGSMYFVFDFNGGTPSFLDRFRIINSENQVVINKQGFASNFVKEGYTYYTEWSNQTIVPDSQSGTLGNTYMLPSRGLSVSQLSDLMRKIKDAGNKLMTAAPTTSDAGVLGQLWTDTTNMHTYQCTAIDDTTDPDNPSYTWTQRW